MSKEKNCLLSSIMCSIIIGMSVLPVHAETIQSFQLDEIIVESSRNHKTALPGGFNNDTSRVGLLGETPVIKAPFTVQSITEETVSKMAVPNQSIDNVLSNVPAIRTGTSPIKTDFSIRGICTNASAYYVNNIPGFFIMATGPVTNTIGSIDVLVGPAATLNGSTPSYQAGPITNSTPGAIYLNTKRAGEKDFIKYTQTVGGYGDYGEYFDVSQRFGDDRQIGVRIYGQYDKGGLPISGASQKKSNIFANVSYEGNSTKTNLFGGYYDEKLWGTERRFSLLKDSTKFPDAPDADKSFDDPDMMHSFTNGYMVTLNHQKKLSENVNWFVNSGLNQTSVRRYIYDGEIGIDQDGNIVSDTIPWSDYILLNSQYLQTGLKATVETGIAKHNMALSVDRSHRKMYKNGVDIANTGMIGGNIYDGINFNPSIYDGDISEKLSKKFQHEETVTSINFMDSIEINKLTLMGAISRRHGNYVGKKVGSEVKDTNWAPTYGVSYAPTEDLSFYAAHAVATTRGTTVSASKKKPYENDGEILDAQRTKNTELGVKYKIDDMLMMTLNYFDMTRPNTIDVKDAAGKLWQTNNGENRYKGIDLSVNARLADKWNACGGVEWLDARQENTQDGKFDGCHTDGSVEWSGVVGLEYMPDENTSITGRISYMGDGKFVCNDRRELNIPSYATVDLFASHKTKINGIPVKLSASCYNVTNDSHWVAQAGQGNKFMINMPRSFVLAAEFEF